MKEPRLWTEEEALVHCEERLKLFEAERAILVNGSKGDNLWANNRGSEAAIARLGELINCYQRIVKLVSTNIRSKA